MKIGSIVIRCAEWERLLSFWSAALHYVPRYPPEDGWVILGDPEGRGPNVSLARVPPGKTLPRRGRLHLDLYAEEQHEEVERLVGLGARRYPWRYQPGDDFVVLEDPDGNLFCVVQA
jgi:catechol 2,3-dioxygenase-like lactoylglutathione lyase family enzyme